jgi:hypothetical protein
MFLCKQKEEHMKGKTFAGQLKASEAAEAIQDVIDEVPAPSSMGATVNFFQRVFPGQFKNVKILASPTCSRTAASSSRKARSTKRRSTSFASALINAPNDPIGKPMLATWKLKGFEKVPDDYDLQLKKVLKTYPSLPAIRAAADK